MGNKVDGTVKRKFYQVINENGDYQQQLLETSADMTTVEDTDDKLGGATNVQEALMNLATGVASAGKVDDVRNGSGTSLVKNKIATVSPSAIGAEAAFTKNTAFNKNFETSVANIKPNGTAAVGTSSNVARADHVHPTDETRASKDVATETTDGLLSAADKKKLDGIAAGAEKNAVTGVKGDSETTYRTGNVNITKANVGLGSVANERQYSANNPNFGTDTPLMDGTATVGTKTTYSRSDHKHPTDTSRASATEFNTFKQSLNKVENTADADKDVNSAKKDGAGNVIVDTYATKTALADGLAGKSNTLTYDTYKAFVTAVNALSNTALKVGDNVLVKTLDVPDMWVTRVDSTATSYTYTNDAAIIDKLNSTTGLQVGYFNFSKLETTKVDVSGIATNASEIAKIKDGTTKVKKAETADNATKLDNQAASYYLDYNNLANRPKVNVGGTTTTIAGTINFHRVAVTGDYKELSNTPITYISNVDTVADKTTGVYYFSRGASDAPDSRFSSTPFVLTVSQPSSNIEYKSIVSGSSVFASVTEAGVSTGWVEYDLSTFAKKTDIPSKASDSEKLGGQLPAYYLNYANATSKPKINSNNSTSQTVLSNKEISGTIQFHKIASTGKFDDLVDSPVHQTDTAGEDGLDNTIYRASGLYQVPVNISGTPFAVTSKTNTQGNAPERMWLQVSKGYVSGDNIYQTTQTLIYGSQIAARYLNSASSDYASATWSAWGVYDLSTLAKKSDIPDITVSPSGSGFVSAVTVDTANKHKLNVTKKAITNADLPDSGANPTANVAYTAVAVNSKGIVTSVANAIEFGTATNNTPSSKLMVGGIFFELVT